MNYVFGCEFQELTQGSRRSPEFHGQATLSLASIERACPEVPAAIKFLASTLVSA